MPSSQAACLAAEVSYDRRLLPSQWQVQPCRGFCWVTCALSLPWRCSVALLRAGLRGRWTRSSDFFSVSVFSGLLVAFTDLQGHVSMSDFPGLRNLPHGHVACSCFSGPLVSSVHPDSGPVVSGLLTDRVQFPRAPGSTAAAAARGGGAHPRAPREPRGGHRWTRSRRRGSASGLGPAGSGCGRSSS